MTNDQIPPELAKVTQVIADATARLDPQDRAERIAFCQQTGNHGTRVDFEDGVAVFTWGDRTLAEVPVSVLLDDQPLPEGQFVAKVPDSVPSEWSEQ